MIDLDNINFTSIPGKNVGDIKIFALSTCGWCKKTKEFLGSHNVAYSFVDIDLAPESEEDELVDIQRSFNSSGSFPTIVVNETETIIGYDMDKLNNIVTE